MYAISQGLNLQDSNC